MKITIVTVIILILHSSFAHIIPNDIRTKEDIADRRMHPSDEEFLINKSDSSKLKRDGEDKNDFWLDIGKGFVDAQIKKKLNKNKAKNVIFFLGDGMSVITYNAARNLLGGEEKSMSFEEFPHMGMVKTYCTNYQVGDSACTSTAYLCGVKGNYGTIGVTGRVPRYNCTAQLDPTTHTESIFKWALESGRSAGIITTASVTDASPAGAYAHTASRYWENDREVKSDGCDPNEIEDIAKQLIRGDGSKFQVILGGGRAHFRNTTDLDETGSAGYRSDGLDLIKEYMDRYAANRTKYVWNGADLRNTNAKELDYLLGFFGTGAMSYHLDVVDGGLQDREPSLSEMTEKAIDVLSKNENGYFLFVENQKIDSGHHSNYARIVLDETVEFSKAIELARSKVNEEDTLIVVTADHSHTMSYNGYGSRGSDIFGPAERSNMDGKPFMTLMYANGPGYSNHMSASEKGRIDLTTVNTTGNKFRYPSALTLSSETHAGEDVSVFAAGPWSHLFSGVYEQSVLPYIISYAACIGDNLLSSCSNN